jgi:ribosomal protein S18 acetylase RimI-like enzyme
MAHMDLRLRPYWGEADLEPIAAVVRAAAIADRLPFVNTAQDFRTDVLDFPGVDPGRDVIVAEAGGRVVAAAWVRGGLRDGEWRVDQEGYVDPGHRRRGIGRALFRAIAARVQEIAASHTDGRERRLTAILDDGDVAGQAIARAEGYAPYRWFAIMGRDLTEPGPEIAAVDGVELKPLRYDERRAVFEALAEAFQDHPGRRVWTDQDFHRMFESGEVDLSLWRVAWAGDEVAGVSLNAFSPGEAEALGYRQGWLHAIGVRRPWRGRGVAKLVIASSLAELRSRGFARAVLAVDIHNPTGALGLYEGLGFVTLARSSSWARTLGSTGR